MSFISPPVSYPPSSSPPTTLECRKRSRINGLPRPSKRRLTDFEDDLLLKARDLTHEFVKFPTIIDAQPKGPFIEDDEDELDDLTMLAMFQSVDRPDATITTPRVLKTDLPCNVHTVKTSGLLRARTSSGEAFTLKPKTTKPQISYEQLIAGRSTTAPNRATKSFYGIDIHHLLDEAAREPKLSSAILGPRSEKTVAPSVQELNISKGSRNDRNMLWTEKYRARKFTDLVGDERTHRDVLRWIKGWDPIVFPGTSKLKPKRTFQDDTTEQRPHRKILLLTGPPGLGKTTLAHVCARQAGYEVVEINASDERSRDVVKGRIRDSVGTENVKGINSRNAAGTVRKQGRPVCVIVDEVDGVVSGSNVGGGEGGFIKALMDLVVLDQKNSSPLPSTSENTSSMRRSKKGDRFRLLRPMILICNDVYHPALRPLRSSMMAEIIHIRKPPLDKVVARLKVVFDKEGVSCDGDGVRRLCEATWGVSSRRESRSSSSSTGEGDIRGILVVAEWVATKLRAAATSSGSKQSRLTKIWIEQHMLENLSHGGAAARGLGRGGAKEAVERVFLDGAGFPKSGGLVSKAFSQTRIGDTVGVSEPGKRNAMNRLREIIDTSGESDRIVTDCFASYPLQPFQDDTFLSKPNAAYDWLHFHDNLSSRIYSGQEWELGPYLSGSVLSFHNLFASPAKHFSSSNYQPWDDVNDEEPVPFSGPRADYMAFEVQKQSKAVLLGLQSSLSIPLLRSFRSTEEIATSLLPYLIRILTPDVKPVIVGGSGEQRGMVSVRKEGERAMIRRAVGIMSGVGVTFERGRVETGQSGVSTFIYRMEPPLDTLATFETASQGGPLLIPARYAIRQALDQEFQKHLIRQSADAAQSRYKAGNTAGQDLDPSARRENVVLGLEGKKPMTAAAERDFFGRIVNKARPQPGMETEEGKFRKSLPSDGGGNKVWVSFHEGFSNAVRKPITIEDLMRGL